MKKFHNNRGETLIEVLASIIIASLSVALMFGCIMVSTNMDEGSKTLDEQHYAGLTAADAQEAASMAAPTPGVGSVTIERVDPVVSGEPTASAELEITIYGDEGMSSYRRATE